ncbi:response regulator transcription factor [Ornithinibacillus halotolerans]|uniref:Transcriptional regulatory protein YvfU n=1 Tax=Ornithinibacillus halotolerans TaxID=1274357 RepID=A0A916W756_9BACI|nr:response regulator transcription factor [Ornithinibacillus halotolerans]GGA72188.1 putative transcriptional regulatory protein YvfU [Ornithinibacillus halotolerans]
MIRVLIAEDQGMLRGALGSLLDFEEDIEIVGEASNGKDALDMILKLQPDICLLDIEMPFMSGLEVAEEVKRRNISCKIIILTTFGRPGYFEQAVKVGVQGYMLKDGSIEELAESIRSVMKGKREFAPELIFGSIQEDNPLTKREQTVLSLASQGKTSKEISSELYLSHGTIRNYMSEIIDKLGVKNRTEAVTVAKENGWI